MTENHGVPGSNPGSATLKVLGITNVGGRHFSVVTSPHNSSALWAQYARDRGESGRCDAVDKVKNRRKENIRLCAFHGSCPRKCTVGST